MLPHERLHTFFYEWSRKLFIAVGHDIYDNKFKPNALAYFLYVMLTLFFISGIYTVAYYDWFIILNVIGYICIGAQLLMKIWSIHNTKQAVALADKLVLIYQQNAKTTSRKRYLLFQRYIIYTEYIFKCGLTLYTLSAVFYFVYPFFRYVKYRDIVPLVSLFLPGVDENSQMGFAILSFFHLIIIMAALLGSACNDFLFTMIIINVPVLAEILGDNVNELNEFLCAKKPDHLMIKMKLRNILLIHQEVMDFVCVLDKSFFNVCFVQIGSGVIATSTLLFLCLKENYFPAYGLTIGCSFQICSFCALGTVIQISNDRIYDSIISGNWFLLSPNEKTMYRFLIFNSQKSKMLTFGGIMPLNMVTCVAIFKTIYSYLMVLYNFVD